MNICRSLGNMAYQHQASLHIHAGLKASDRSGWADSGDVDVAASTRITPKAKPSTGDRTQYSHGLNYDKQHSSSHSTAAAGRGRRMTALGAFLRSTSMCRTTALLTQVTRAARHHLLPFSASCSMLYPGLGSLDRFSTRAKRSRQLPTAMSMVSPKI